MNFYPTYHLVEIIALVKRN